MTNIFVAFGGCAFTTSVPLVRLAEPGYISDVRLTRKSNNVVWRNMMSSDHGRPVPCVL